MEVAAFRREEIPLFLELASAEGWITSHWEMGYLLDVFPQGCLACQHGAAPVAFVTAMRHGDSGWIGNLIVEKGSRGRGAGTLLMTGAMAALHRAGARTVWLTASAAGRPIYERLGFRAIDTVERWAGQGRGGGSPTGCGVVLEEALAVDRAGWGDRRESLVAATIGRGRAVGIKGGFLVIQPLGDSVQLGPWGCVEGADAAELLDRAVTPGEGSPIFLDVPGGNHGATTLLRSRGFRPMGRTILMYRGERPGYAPRRIFALASMGSMG